MADIFLLLVMLRYWHKLHAMVSGVPRVAWLGKRDKKAAREKIEAASGKADSRGSVSRGSVSRVIASRGSVSRGSVSRGRVSRGSVASTETFGSVVDEGVQSLERAPGPLASFLDSRLIHEIGRIIGVKTRAQTVVPNFCSIQPGWDDRFRRRRALQDMSTLLENMGFNTEFVATCKGRGEQAHSLDNLQKALADGRISPDVCQELTHEVESGRSNIEADPEIGFQRVVILELAQLTRGDGRILVELGKWISGKGTKPRILLPGLKRARNEDPIKVLRAKLELDFQWTDVSELTFRSKYEKVVMNSLEERHTLQLPTKYIQNIHIVQLAEHRAQSKEMFRSGAKGFQRAASQNFDSKQQNNKARGSGRMSGRMSRRFSYEPSQGLVGIPIVSEDPSFPSRTVYSVSAREQLAKTSATLYAWISVDDWEFLKSAEGKELLERWMKECQKLLEAQLISNPGVNMRHQSARSRAYQRASEAALDCWNEGLDSQDSQSNSEVSSDDANERRSSRSAISKAIAETGSLFIKSKKVCLDSGHRRESWFNS